jgi:peptidoglycan/xylan/chitin deacetylase (PgdA/CDA1 family)
MKNSIRIIICIFCSLPLLAFSQAGKICNWKDDKKAAVVLSFDDWSPGQYPVVLPELNSRGLIATFFPETSLITSWNHDWPTVVATAAAGNEIGNHTVTHPHLTAKTSSELNMEITGAKNLVDVHITSQKVVSFAYPFGEYNTKVLDTIKANGHICARTVNPPSGIYYTYNFATTNDDYYRLCTYPMNGAVTSAAFTAQIQNVINGGGLLTYLYHSVDNAAGTYGDNWYARVLQDSLKRQLDTVVVKQNLIWVTTFGNSTRYHREKRCALLSEIQASNGTLWIVDLTDTLANNSLYNQPLTLKLKMNSVAYDHVTQNGNALSFTINGDTIMFDAVPDGGQIALSVGALSANLQPTLNSLSNLTINQTDGIQTVNLSGISAGGSESQNLTITAVAYCNNLLQSNLIQNLTVNYTSAATTGTVTFNPNASASGIVTIVVRVTDDGAPASYIEKLFTVSIASVTSLKNETSLSEILIAPNPTSGFFSISSGTLLTSTTISVEEVSGTILYENFFPSIDQLQLDLSGKKAGVYILKMRSDQGVMIKKIIVL